MAQQYDGSSGDAEHKEKQEAEEDGADAAAGLLLIGEFAADGPLLPGARVRLWTVRDH